MTDTTGSTPIDIDNLSAEDLAAIISQGGSAKAKATTVTAPNPFTTVGNVTARSGPIGVNDTYRAKYRNQRLSDSNQMAASQGGFEYVSPQYFENDLSAFAGLSPETMTQVQYKLKDAGLLKSFHKGVWDDNNENTMAKVLAYANRTGLLWEDALNEYASMAEEIGGSGGAAGPSFTARYSNPDDVKKAFAQGLYEAQGGRFFDEGHLNSMVDAYHQREYQQQRAMFDNAAEVTEAPTAQTFAAEEAKTLDPAGVQAKKVADFGKVFEDVIGAA